jgi:hypothetical protein
LPSGRRASGPPINLCQQLAPLRFVQKII